MVRNLSILTSNLHRTKYLIKNLVLHLKSDLTSLKLLLQKWFNNM